LRPLTSAHGHAQADRTERKADRAGQGEGLARAQVAERSGFIRGRSASVILSSSALPKMTGTGPVRRPVKVLKLTR
jgi:hypothetical protein